MFMTPDPVLSTQSCPLRIEVHLIAAKSYVHGFFPRLPIHQDDALLDRHLETIHRDMTGMTGTPQVHRPRTVPPRANVDLRFHIDTGVSWVKLIIAVRCGANARP